MIFTFCKKSYLGTQKSEINVKMATYAIQSQNRYLGLLKFSAIQTIKEFLKSFAQKMINSKIVYIYLDMFKIMLMKIVLDATVALF